MPRHLRLDVAHAAQHVVQRGNDRRPCFFEAVDYECYRRELREITLADGCAVHAYVFMINRVHLLMTLVEVGQIAYVMQSFGRRYVRYVNDRPHRTGTLWKDVTNPASWIRTTTCCAAIAISNSTPCGLR